MIAEAFNPTGNYAGTGDEQLDAEIEDALLDGDVDDLGDDDHIEVDLTEEDQLKIDNVSEI